MLQGQIPHREGLILGIARFNAPLMLMVELAQAGGHLAAAGAGSRYYDHGSGGLNIIILTEAVVRYHQREVGRILRNIIVTIGADAKALQPPLKSHCGALPGIPGQHHAAYIQPIFPECVDQAHHIQIIGNTQITPALILLNVIGIDGNDNLCLVLQLHQHSHLAVRQEARQHPGRMEVIKQLAAEFQIELAAKICHPLLNLLGLKRQVFLIVKSDFLHVNLLPVHFFHAYNKI